MSAPEAKIPILIGVLQDNHNVGIRVLGYALERAGYDVIYVGARLSQEDFVNAAVETDARAIMVSTSNGHAALDARGMRGKCVESGIGDVLLYLGGNLSVNWSEQDWEGIEGEFREMGFDRVYPPTVHPDEVIGALESDLAR
jgi:methylaspartate mutase sigma subunit